LFFQAEDGIRDRNVTGVQTCALPISEDAALLKKIQEKGIPCVIAWNKADLSGGEQPKTGEQLGTKEQPIPIVKVSGATGQGIHEIGRASCRERVERAVAAGVEQEKRW